MDSVYVPVRFLLDRSMTASAKVVWMTMRLYRVPTKAGRPSPTQLAALTGLSRPTVRKGLASLAAAGWFQPLQAGQGSPHATVASPHSRTSADPDASSQVRSQIDRQIDPHAGPRVDPHVDPRVDPHVDPRVDPQVGPQVDSRVDSGVDHRVDPRVRPQGSHAQPSTRRSVMIPRQLLEDRAVKPHAVVMFGVLQATPGFRRPSGRFTSKLLEELTGTGVKVIRRSIGLLIQRGWLEVVRTNRRHPFTFTIRNPILEECEAELARVQKRISREKHLGEALMKEFLTLIVDSQEFEDNARPGFLVNPYTDERLELDRYYPGRVAFEFNGPQHYRPTETSSAQEVEKQRARDHIKAGICEDRGIRVVVVHPEDLTLETMLRKVSPYLPVRDLRNSELIVEHLEERSRDYRNGFPRGESSFARVTASPEGQAASPEVPQTTALSPAP